jgi:hypothetical protein
MSDSTEPEVLSAEDSAIWRQAYLEAFVDMSTEGCAMRKEFK